MKEKMYKLTKEECDCDVVDFYDNVARHIGYSEVENLKYDCRYICVSTKIMESVVNHYVNKMNITRGQAELIWLHYGPKANIDSDDYCVRIDDKFIECGDI